MENTISYSIPATLFDFKEGKNPLYSLAKLKIFYVGLTADKRLFTKEFSDELLKSLPYVPVVGFYDKESEDFKGHNPSIQNIYGLVPETTKIEYVKEDGKEFAVCDIILYTGRKDETGEIAQKIVGKSHSLELNPEDTTYVVNKDANGKTQNIEFKTGSLIGLSVLGDNEKPAFTGSEFFKNYESEEDFKRIQSGFMEEWAEFVKKTTTNDVFSKATEFMKKTYTEKIMEIANALSSKYNYFYVAQLFDDYCVVAVLNEETFAVDFFRISYSSENDSLMLGEPILVYPRYLTEAEATNWDKVMETNKPQPTTEVTTGVKEDEDDDEEDDEDEEEEEFQNETGTQTQTAPVEENLSTTNDVQHEGDLLHEEGSTATPAVEQPKSSTGEGQETKTTEAKEVVSTSLADSERTELEAFRKERKLSLIAGFAEDLSGSFIEKLQKEVNQHSYEELELILSKEYTRVMKESKTIVKTQKFSPLAYIANNTSTEESSIKSLIDKYKDK